MRVSQPSSYCRLRRLTERGVLVVLAVTAMRTWYVEGLLVPLRITGGSMALTLLGPHYDVQCGDCEHQFVCGADLRQPPPRAVCPLCGYADNRLPAQSRLAGDGIVLSKSIFRLRQPRRWEVVAFRRGQPPYRTYVKRVVGLPGESIQIRHGDVYVEGQIQRKTLSQQWATAILVHDAAWQPPDLPPRWQAESERTTWGSDGGRFARGSDMENDPTDDWLVYHHWRRVAGKEDQVDESPITDLCGYNQTQPRREEDVHPVSDLMLSLKLVETRGEGVLAIRASDGRDEFKVLLYPNRQRYKVLRNNHAVPGAADKSSRLTDGVSIVVSLFDKQLLLAFDGRPVVTRQYDPSASPLLPTSRPLAIGSQGGLGVTISNVRVYRDVYYACPIGLQKTWGIDEPYQLGGDEYFVLGDNSPISEDSRNWPSAPAIPAKLLIGKPLVVHFPARLVRLGRWEFQVPDPAKIRYIR